MKSLTTCEYLIMHCNLVDAVSVNRYARKTCRCPNSAFCCHCSSARRIAGSGVDGPATDDDMLQALAADRPTPLLDSL
jgi:hypothetical protein